MHRIGLAMLAAGSLLAAGSTMSTSAAAMTAGPLAALSSVADVFEMTQQIACVRQGWHGVGNYPSCERPPKKKRTTVRKKD
jgi:hypothetical protein